MDALIHQILTDIDAGQNPYFVALHDGGFALDDFIETQIQFYFAVIFFPRPMAACAAKIPDARLRLPVLQNVWEEHGEGGEGVAHGETFLTLLHRLDGVTVDDINARALWPEVRMFNTTLSGACVLDEHIVGASVLGIIECMFAQISAWLGRSFVHRGWLTTEEMIHYDLHASLDVQHAEDFFAVLRPRWAESSANQYYIEQGLRLGAHTFDTLYRGLYRARARRDLRVEIRDHLRC